jgi:hypothetical protein
MGEIGKDRKLVKDILMFGKRSAVSTRSSFVATQSPRNQADLNEKDTVITI